MPVVSCLTTATPKSFEPRRKGKSSGVRGLSDLAASAPGAAELEAVLVGEDGEVSTYLTDELRVGDQLELRGPIGGYFAWHVSLGGPLLLVAGGSGLVPLMAMLRHRATAKSTAEATVLVSARSWEEVLYRDELATHQGHGVTVRYTLTRKQPPGWAGWAGRVNVDMLRELGADPGAQLRVFVCGPTGFVEHAADLLVQLGHDPHRIKTERFGPTGG